MDSMDEEDEGPGAWALAFLALVLTLLCALVGYALLLTRRNERAAAAAAEEEERPAAPRRGRSAAGLLRRRGAREAGGDDEGEEEGEEGGAAAGGASRRARLERRRAEKRAEREAARLEREAEQEAARLRLRGPDAEGTGYEARRRAREAERERAEREAEEEAARAEEERARKEDEENARWMGTFTVEEDGTAEADARAEGQGLLAEFIAYIRRRRCVVLEDCAAEFGLRTQDVIGRIASLEAIGRLTGVMDERGKYIYVSVEDMARVAEFIERRGRVSLRELTRHMNEVIDIAPEPDEPAERGG